MALYTRFEDVRVRLLGKVRFTDDEDEENKMHVLLARRLINEAEGQVEVDLSPRYMAPFQKNDGSAFKNLPSRPTQEWVKTLCELKSAIRILQTDFGRGSATNGDAYKGDLEKQYDKMIKDHLAIRDQQYKNWVQPPLPDLMLNFGNAATDDGFSGEIIHTTHGEGGFPRQRINDPSQTYWNATIDDIIPEAPCKPLSPLNGG
jgi:hypothetical protein